MSKTTKIIAALGVVAGLGVAALPAFTFAEGEPSVTGDVEVIVDVDAAIAMTIAGNYNNVADSFLKVTPEGTENPSEEGWYEYNGTTHQFTLTEETTVGSKTYYELKDDLTYANVSNFAPDSLTEGTIIDTYTVPAAAVLGTSASHTNILPGSVVNGDTSARRTSATPANDFGSTITVYTNNTSGYTLTVEDKDDVTDLTREDGAAYIPSTADGTAVQAGTAGWNIDVNRAGLADLTAKAVPVKGSALTIDTSNAKTSGGRITYVDYNVATNNDQATGTYADVIVYTATTNV